MLKFVLHCDIPIEQSYYVIAGLLCFFCFVDLTFTLFQLPPFCMAGGKTATWSRLQEYQVDSTGLQVG